MLNAHKDYTLQGDWLSCHIATVRLKSPDFQLAGNPLVSPLLSRPSLPPRPSCPVSDVPSNVSPPPSQPLHCGASDFTTVPSDKGGPVPVRGQWLGGNHPFTCHHSSSLVSRQCIFNFSLTRPRQIPSPRPSQTPTKFIDHVEMHETGTEYGVHDSIVTGSSPGIGP